MSELLARITIDPNRMHGRPCIRDLGITVADILGLLAAGQSRETILGDYPDLESADVDRDGKVASVRVISGPPLLRDAALDAVQRWRYRPYLSSGGPIPMAAIEIMDFQLP